MELEAAFFIVAIVLGALAAFGGWRGWSEAIGLIGGALAFIALGLLWPLLEAA